MGRTRCQQGGKVHRASACGEGQGLTANTIDRAGELRATQLGIIICAAANSEIRFRPTFDFGERRMSDSGGKHGATDSMQLPRSATVIMAGVMAREVQVVVPPRMDAYCSE